MSDIKKKRQQKMKNVPLTENEESKEPLSQKSMDSYSEIEDVLTVDKKDS